jgi:hypothetical protein
VGFSEEVAATAEGFQIEEFILDHPAHGFGIALVGVGRRRDADGNGKFAPITRCSMKMKLLSLLGLGVGLLLISTAVLAHHGASAYDTKKLTTLKGTVTDFQFMNPHTEILFNVTGADGKVEQWTAEAASLVTMSRLGWTKNIMKPGEQITAVGNCAKNGSHTMRLRKIVLPDGKETVVDRGEDYADQ